MHVRLLPPASNKHNMLSQRTGQEVLLAVWLIQGAEARQQFDVLAFRSALQSMSIPSSTIQAGWCFIGWLTEVLLLFIGFAPNANISASCTQNTSIAGANPPGIGV